MKRIVWIVSLFLLFANRSFAEPNDSSRPAAGKRIVYQIPGMERVPVRRDLTYKTVEDVELKMDVYYPANLPSGAYRPAVILVPGEILIYSDPKSLGYLVS